MAGNISLIPTVGMAILGSLFLTFCENVDARQSESTATQISADLLPPPRLAPDQIAKGWIALFDGRSLFGWRAESRTNWHVENGELVADEGESGLLRTASQFDDFELWLEYASEATTQVFLRTSPKPRGRDAIAIDVAETAGEYRKLRIKVVVDVLEIAIDGSAIDLSSNAIAAVRRGYIGLHFNGKPVRFRKVLLRPIFTPDDTLSALSAWHASHGIGFTAKTPGNQTIELTGGPGFLESRKPFANFIFQSQCNISMGGNSGVFFRCIPGENTNGYESQIDNSMTDGDPGRPANGGTGGVFRRKDARRIVARDEAWFAKTIVVEGPHVAVWVNGFQVTDWTDKRAPNVNPRRGLRMQAGSLMLQGHDEHTSVRFREIRVREIHDRR